MRRNTGSSRSIVRATSARMDLQYHFSSPPPHFSVSILPTLLFFFFQTAGDMGRPITEFKARLDKATASRKEDGVPNVAVIAADGNGTRLFLSILCRFVL